MKKIVTAIGWTSGIVGVVRGIPGCTRAFARDRRGATYTYFALLFLPLLGIMGMATDIARGYLVKARLSKSLDAAGLAGARKMTSPNLAGEIKMFFDANFGVGYLGSTITGPTFTLGDNGEKLTVVATAKLPTIFMRLFGYDILTVAAESEITRKTSYLDVVLSIDMSGSMGTYTAGKRRIDAAREAANELVNILFGDSVSKNLLKIGIVPWNGKVNVTDNGIAYKSWQTTSVNVPTFTNPVTGASQSKIYFANNSAVPLLKAPPSSWKGCVFARYRNDGNEATNADTKAGLNIWTPSGTWAGWEPVGPEGEPVNYGTCSMSVYNSECTPCLDHGISRMQNVKSVALAAIDELRNPTGVTNIAQGLAWAWRVLVPEAPFTEADPNPPLERIQAVVLLTDGEHIGGSGDGYKTVFGYNTAAQTGMDARLRAIAAAMKAQGIRVYAIQFANGSGALATLMKQIATEPNSPYYHYAPDAAALRAAFNEIANNLSLLRISR